MSRYCGHHRRILDHFENEILISGWVSKRFQGCHSQANALLFSGIFSCSSFWDDLPYNCVIETSFLKLTHLRYVDNFDESINFQKILVSWTPFKFKSDLIPSWIFVKFSSIFFLVPYTCEPPWNHSFKIYRSISKFHQVSGNRALK